MSRQGTIRRYSLIIEKLSHKQCSSFGKIKNHLIDHGFEISSRTIQRDINQIRFEFGVDIQYYRTRNGYYINEDNSLNLESFLRFLEIVNTADLLTESLKESKDVLEYISFESQGDLKGVENLKSLLFAAKNHRKISFVHENFSADTKKKTSLNPYLLKEYQNRWYVVGIPKGIKEFRTYGIDRIEGLDIKTQTFVPDSKVSPVELFDNIIGLAYSYNNLEEVILSLTPFQWKYVKALPLHISQEVLEENDQKVIIKLTIIPNYEFKQKILMLGDQATVLKPEWLVKEFADTITKMLKHYKPT